jgi:hypothetical protein
MLSYRVLLEVETLPIYGRLACAELPVARQQGYMISVRSERRAKGSQYRQNYNIFQALTLGLGLMLLEDVMTIPSVEHAHLLRCKASSGVVVHCHNLVESAKGNSVGKKRKGKVPLTEIRALPFRVLDAVICMV